MTLQKYFTKKTLIEEVEGGRKTVQKKAHIYKYYILQFSLTKKKKDTWKSTKATGEPCIFCIFSFKYPGHLKIEIKKLTKKF